MPTRRTTSPTSGRPTVRPLDATATAAVNALVAAYNASDSFLVSAVRGPAAEAQRAVPRFAEYVERSQALYPALARYAVLGDDAGSLVAAREALEETTAALISERRDSALRRRRHGRRVDVGARCSGDRRRRAPIRRDECATETKAAKALTRPSRPVRGT